jgi:hypothetical protein
VSVCPLHKVSSLPQMLMGQIAQNRCYKLVRVKKNKADMDLQKIRDWFGLLDKMNLEETKNEESIRTKNF